MIENNKDNSIYDSPKFLPFTDDRIFMNVMRSPKICRALLELILPNEEIGAIRIKKSDNPFLDNSAIDEKADESMSIKTQKTLKLGADAHGVRFDAFVESSKLWADIEMQTSDGSELDIRARYYHANMDLDFLEQGQPYKDLKPSYVIFICTFDPFGLGRHIYTFENRCSEDIALTLNDGTVKIILNTKGTLDDVSPEMKRLLDYVDGKGVSDTFTRDLEEAVQSARQNEKWRLDYMTLQQEYRERFREGKIEGKIEGKVEILYEELHMTVAEIAEKLVISEEEVQKIVDALENA